MSAEPVFDSELAHTRFSVECFNSTWELIDKKERTPDEDLMMLARAIASLWHWTQRPDCTPRNLSIGYWQVSRVCALIGDGTLARHYAEACLRFSRDEGPFFLGFVSKHYVRQILRSMCWMKAIRIMPPKLIAVFSKREKMRRLSFSQPIRRSMMLRSR